MRTDKDAKLKELLKLAGSEKPGADFTATIMQMIEADVQREEVLKTVLQKADAEGPSFSFTAKVMAGVQQARKDPVLYQPIISKKVWIGIAASVVLMFLVSLFPGSTNNGTPGYKGLTRVVDYVYSIPPTYIGVLAVLTMILVADYLFNQQKSKTHNPA